MAKKIFLAAVIVGVLAQAGFALEIENSNHIVILTETFIKLETNTWENVTVNGKSVYLYLDETNPTFFSLVYNTLKDFKMNRTDICGITTTENTSPINGRGTYAKITYLYLY